MNRCHQRSLRHHGGRHRRSGVFAYVMIYVTLSLMLLGLLGTTLHLLFRSSETDRRLFHDLARIRDVERQLRADVEGATDVQFSDDQLVFDSRATTVTWTNNINRTTREVLRGGVRDALTTVTFRRGTRLAFVAESKSLFALRITPPAPASNPEIKNPTRINTPLRAVEILLAHQSSGR